MKRNEHQKNVKQKSVKLRKLHAVKVQINDRMIDYIEANSLEEAQKIAKQKNGIVITND